MLQLFVVSCVCGRSLPSRDYACVIPSSYDIYVCFFLLQIRIVMLQLHDAIRH